jgi:hypothetical protein
MKNLTMIVIGILAPATVSGCAVSPSDDGSDESQTQQGLEDGVIDTNHPFDVGICAGGLVPDGQPNAGTCVAVRCSGTLIAPNVVITARHCVKAQIPADVFCDSQFSDDPITSSPVFVTPSATVSSGTPHWYDVDHIEVPPNNGLCTDDIALIFLTRDISRHEAWPVGINVHRDAAKHPPKEVAIVGRGVLDFNLNDGTTDTGGLLRRILTHIPFVCASDDPANTCQVVDFSSPPTNLFITPTAHLVIGGAITPGDSGAGVFDQKHFHQHSPNVIGVAAASTFAEDGSPNFGLVGRIDTHADFIRQALHHCGHDEFVRDYDETDGD